MGRGARLSTDQARRQRFEECRYLITPQLLPNNNLLVGVDPVNLQHVLGDIQTNRANLSLPPLVDPQILDEVEIDVGQERADDRALWRSLLRHGQVALFEHTCC